MIWIVIFFAHHICYNCQYLNMITIFIWYHLVVITSVLYFNLNTTRQLTLIVVLSFLVSTDWWNFRQLLLRPSLYSHSADDYPSCSSSSSADSPVSESQHFQSDFHRQVMTTTIWVLFSNESLLCWTYNWMIILTPDWKKVNNWLTKYEL